MPQPRRIDDCENNCVSKTGQFALQRCPERIANAFPIMKTMNRARRPIHART